MMSDRVWIVQFRTAGTQQVESTECIGNPSAVQTMCDVLISIGHTPLFVVTDRDKHVKYGGRLVLRLMQD